MIIKYFKLNKRGITIFDVTIKNHITRRWLEEGTSSFSLMEYYFKNLNYHITYIPNTPGNYLMSFIFLIGIIQKYTYNT